MNAATVMLDNEAVQALLDVGHRKHRRVSAMLVELNRRNLRRPSELAVVVPVAVRVEAGWNRANPASASADWMARARDKGLDSRDADRAVALRQQVGVSVVDACVGAALESVSQPVAVLTSDVGDMRRLADACEGVEVRVIAL